MARLGINERVTDTTEPVAEEQHVIAVTVRLFAVTVLGVVTFKEHVVRADEVTRINAYLYQFSL